LDFDSTARALGGSRGEWCTVGCPPVAGASYRGGAEAHWWPRGPSAASPLTSGEVLLPGPLCFVEAGTPLGETDMLGWLLGRGGEGTTCGLADEDGVGREIVGAIGWVNSGAFEG
jgi:hypothetical protein